jgi:flagellar biosynthesis/type III secretory pathway M-ring protein FliF/YscJ
MLLSLVSDSSSSTSFWNIIWYIFVAYLFFAYLLVLFSVIADIFRNRESSGLIKACWIFLLIVLPILTLIVYLIVYGKDMGERSSRQAQAMQAQQESYIKDVAGTNSPADQISQAKKLLDAGAISQAEYDSMKAKALS